MTEQASRRPTGEYGALLSVSARLGQNPLQVQGPGGNTSLKSGDIMWIKASGTWLADADRADIMVPVDANRMRQSLVSGDPRAEDPANFVITASNPSGLRASIETPVHAVLPWKVVLHTHCVATIAIAVRTDADTIVAERLSGMGAIFIPYAKPGASLARAIHARLCPDTKIAVLGNHGLVACGDSVAEAESLLLAASRRLAPERVQPVANPRPSLAAQLQGTGWVPAPHAALHAIAMDPARLRLARGTSLYPDHVVFLGPGVRIEPSGTDRARLVGMEPHCNLLVLEGEGVAVRADASRPVLALARCLGDVLARVDPAAQVNRLRETEEFELLNWDAEKQRQSLNQARTAVE